MRISDWSSDVCSSDLAAAGGRRRPRAHHPQRPRHEPGPGGDRLRQGAARDTRPGRRAGGDAVGLTAERAMRRILLTAGAPELTVESVDEASAEPLEDRKSTRLNSSH